MAQKRCNINYVIKVVLITQVMLKPWRVCRKEVEPRKSEEWWRSKRIPKRKTPQGGQSIREQGEICTVQ